MLEYIEMIPDRMGAVGGTSGEKVSSPQQYRSPVNVSAQVVAVPVATAAMLVNSIEADTAKTSFVLP